MLYPCSVDTLTHALSGALLARVLTRSRPQTATGTQRWFGPPVPVWQAVTVGFIAAAVPDADFALQFVSDIAYLRGHRGVTHSIILLPLWSLLLGGVFALAFGRWTAWKRYSWLCAAALAIHIAGDVITQFGTMIFAPLSDRRVELGSTFIIDLAISGILLAGLALSALFRRSRVPAAVALLLLPLWISVSLTGRSEALAVGTAYAAATGLPAVAISAAPRPASPFNWTVLVDDGEHYHVAHINTRRSERLTARADDNFIRRLSAPYMPIERVQWQVRPKFGAAAEAPLARVAWAHPRFDFFRWFALFPALDHVERDDARTCVWFRDLRFEMPGRNSVPFRYGMCRQNEATDWQLYTLDGEARIPLPDA